MRLTVDNASARGPAASAVPTRLTVTPLRGYDAQANQVERLLAGLPGVTAAGGSAFQLALAALGWQAGDYSSQVDAALTPSMPAVAAVRACWTSPKPTSTASSATSTPSSCTISGSPSAGRGPR